MPATGFATALTSTLTPREGQVVELLLQGWDNPAIAKELHIAERTVKANLNRLFLRFRIRDGIKRVKLATLFYRDQLAKEHAEKF